MSRSGVFSGLKTFFFGNSGNGAASASSASASKSLARSRLHFVLVQDRTGLTAEEMANFKREMVEVIERYFVIEDRELDISYKRDSDSTTLLINSPIKVRRVGDKSTLSASVDKVTKKEGAKGSPAAVASSGSPANVKEQAGGGVKKDATATQVAT